MIQFNLKCVIPLFNYSISTEIENIRLGMHSLGDKIFSSIYNTINRKGIMAQASKCLMEYTVGYLNHDFIESCESTQSIIGYENEENEVFILKASQVLNGSMNIFNDTYEVFYKKYHAILALQEENKFLGLSDCSSENIMESLNNYLQEISTITTELPDVPENDSWYNKPINILGTEIPTTLVIVILTGFGLLGVISMVATYFLGYRCGKNEQSFHEVQEYKDDSYRYYDHPKQNVQGIEPYAIVNIEDIGIAGDTQHVYQTIEEVEIGL